MRAALKGLVVGAQTEFERAEGSAGSVHETMSLGTVPPPESFGRGHTLVQDYPLKHVPHRPSRKADVDNLPAI